MHDHVTVLSAEIVSGQGRGVWSGDSLAVLSAAVVRAARAVLRDSREVFAAKAGVSADLIAGIENGTRPSWQVSYTEFSAVADALSALNPGLREVFTAAAGCDLLLSCVLSGEGAFGTDELTGTAVALLRWALTGEAVTVAGVSLRAGPPVLGAAQVALLRRRAMELAGSGAPDAWVGSEILALFGGAR